MCSTDIFLGILAILFPPLPVWVKRGLCSADSIINILLCILGFIPGLLHSWYIIARYPDPYDYEYQSLPQDREGHQPHVIYVVQGQPGAQGGINYGTQGQSISSQQHQPQQQGHVDAGVGGSADQGVPPSYAEVVAGDNKIQSQE